MRKKNKRLNSSINSYNRITYSDTLTRKPITNFIVTSGLNYKTKKFEILSETGLGKYSDEFNEDSLGYGELISLHINLDPSLSWIPLQIHAYRISHKVVNNNSIFINTSMKQAQSAASIDQQNVGSNGVLQQTGSGIVPMGQLANNRQGFDISAYFKLKSLSKNIFPVESLPYRL